MILNLIVILFILLMAMYWYTQGFFSAFLHLMLVIFAGSLAFAFWEPAAHFLLNTNAQAAYYAWGVSLLGIFLLVLTASRLAMDYFIRKNMQFGNLGDMVGGGVCGLAAGTLTAGLTVIGLSFMPLPAEIAGYQRHQLTAAGTLEDTGDRLWSRADDIAAAVFNHLSANAFAPAGGRSLQQHRPDIIQQASLFRLRYDPDASPVVPPNTVQVTDAIRLHRLPEALHADTQAALNELRGTDEQWVLVDTQWTRDPASFDQGAVRISPTQIRLLAEDTRGRMHLYEPLGFSNPQRRADHRRMRLFREGRVQAFTSDDGDHFGWLFSIDADHQPHTLIVRQVRYALPAELDEEDDLFLALIGQHEPADEIDDEPTRTATADAASDDENFQVTTRLPNTFSVNHFIGSIDHDSGAIYTARGQTRDAGGGGGEATRIERLYEPGYRRIVRLRIEDRRASTLLGRIHQRARDMHGVWLEDERGQREYPIGYVYQRRDGTEELRINPDRPMQQMADLPLDDLRSGETLYLYFAVHPEAIIESYHVGADRGYPVNVDMRRVD